MRKALGRLRPRPPWSTVLVVVLLLVMLGATYIAMFWALRPKDAGTELSLSQFDELVTSARIREVSLRAEDGRLVGVLADKRPFFVVLGDNDLLASGMLSRLPQSGVATRVDAQVSKARLRATSAFLLPGVTLFVALAVAYVVFRGAGAGGSDLRRLGKSRAREYTGAGGSGVTFADVAGAEDAIEELRDVTDMLAAPERFEEMGARPLRGVLLMGPPGCGKTLLAKAVAGEAGVPFFSISASEFVEMLVGVGAARVRDLFEKARAAAPSIVFVDEIDAIGRARAAGETLNAESESTLNELLVQLDGFDPSDRVALMAATNRPDVLDSALVRKGRFDRRVVVDAPALAGRRAIFGLHAQGKRLAPDLDLESVAARTAGFSGADIAATMNESAILAARRRLPHIGNAEISEAIERVIAGPERRTRILRPDEKRRVACHEAGHAVVAWTLGPERALDRVSVVSRGHALGSTRSPTSDDRQLTTRSQLENEVTVLLAGRIAEDLVYADTSSGARDDIERATNLAYQMTCELGMSDTFGPMVVAGRGGASGGSLVADADTEVRRLIGECDERARAVLTTHRAGLDRLTELLVARETLEGAELIAALEGVPGGGDATSDLASLRRT